MRQKRVRRWSKEYCAVRIVPYRGIHIGKSGKKSDWIFRRRSGTLWDAIINMFEHDHSAARGKMAVRKLIIFKHSKELGDCPAYKLFDAVEVKKQDEAAYPRNIRIMNHYS